MPRRGWSRMEVPGGCRSFGDRGRGWSNGLVRQLEPSRENIRDTPVWGPRVEGHRSAGEGVQVRGSFDGFTRCGGPRSRGFASCAEALEGGDEAAGGRSNQRVRSFPVTGPSSSCRARCQAGHCVLEHSRGRTAVGSVETNAAVHPASTSGRRRRTPAVASDSCPNEGQLKSAKPALEEGQAPKRVCKRENFVPMCVEKLQEWKRDDRSI